MRFVFLDPGPLIDDELTLVPPDVRYLDELLAAATHPLTRRDMPSFASTNRQKQLDFLKSAPGGHSREVESPRDLPAQEDTSQGIPRAHRRR